MISEWELWACANHVHGQHGIDAPRAIAERIETLAQAGDRVGVATWQAIAELYTTLVAPRDEAIPTH